MRGRGPDAQRPRLRWRGPAFLRAGVRPARAGPLAWICSSRPRVTGVFPSVVGGTPAAQNVCDVGISCVLHRGGVVATVTNRSSRSRPADVLPVEAGAPASLGVDAWPKKTLHDRLGAHRVLWTLSGFGLLLSDEDP